MGHLVLKYPTSEVESVQVESRFYFAEKYLDLVRAAKGEWVIWYLPKRAGISLFGAYVAIAFAGDVFRSPDSRKYYMALSKFEKLDPPVRAVSADAIYEGYLAEPGRRTFEQQTVRPIHGQEFVNILEDHIIGTDGQAHFSTTPQSDDDRAKRMILLGNLVQAAREKNRKTFPQTN